MGPEPDNEASQPLAAPYATGGGGTTLEHRYGAQFLGWMLLRTPLAILNGQAPTTIAFQQANLVALDDLLVSAADETTVVRAAIACRRRPRLTQSDAQSKDLVANLVRTDLAWDGDDNSRLGVAAAGVTPPVGELAELAGLARTQPTAADFTSRVMDSEQFNRLRPRLRHLHDLVAEAQRALESDGSVNDGRSPEERTWSILHRLFTFDLDLESANERHWVAMSADLAPLTVDGNLEAGTALRDELFVLAGEFAQRAAVITEPMLRRRLHLRLDDSVTRKGHGWRQLSDLHTQAGLSVSRELIGSPGTEPLTLPRTKQRSEVLTALTGNATGLLITGPSGSGKSAIVLDAVDSLTSDPGFDGLVLNLRQLPGTSVELSAALGSSLPDLLLQLTAPRRVLVIDGADAVVEGREDLFRSLVTAAHAADVTVAAVATIETAGVIVEHVRTSEQSATQVQIPGLDDDDLASVAAHYPELRRLVDNDRSRDLLRRPVVIDLLLRAGNAGQILSDGDALGHVWKELVRNGERSTLGMPDDREGVMLALAADALQPRLVDELVAALDAAAVFGLRQAGLLQPPSPLAWERVPQFAHDVVRAYAVARRLLTDRDPADALARVDVPRWALPAARLATQVLLASPETSDLPQAGRLEREQGRFDALAAAGHGTRWSEVPIEAALEASNSGNLVRGAWGTLTAGDANGLKRLLRILTTRHSKGVGTDPAIADPIIDVLLDQDLPRSLAKDTSDLYTSWLTAHAIAGTGAGHPIRQRLVSKIVEQCAQSEAEIARALAEAEAARVARTLEQVAADEERAQELARLTPVSGRLGRTGRARSFARDWIHEDDVRHLALAGPDMGDGEALLRRIAAEDPDALKPAVETYFAAGAIAAKDPQLLTYLTEAYYIDLTVGDDDDGGWGFSGRFDEEGIRDHEFDGLGGRLFAYYKGPFLTMFQVDFVGGIRCLNRMLNHGARQRVATLHRHRWSGAEPESEDRFQWPLSITGEQRIYIGDNQTWLWYRGTGVGPYPCMSALQALEMVTDGFIDAGLRVDRLVQLLLSDAENLAMPAFVVGMLVRHLEQAGTELDPFLVEPLVWHLEFGRYVHEHGGLAATVPNLHNPKRRSWTLREASMMLMLRASGDRLSELAQLGDDLYANAERQMGGDDTPATRGELAAVRGWADALDRTKYDFTEQDGQLLIQQATNPSVEEVLGETNADLRRTHDALGLSNRHSHLRTTGDRAPTLTADELATDIATARDLLEQPPATGLGAGADGPVAAAASALELHLERGVAVESDDLVFCASVLLGVAQRLANLDSDPFDDALVSLGPDRPAARGLPFLLLPAAQELRAALGLEPPDGTDTFVEVLRQVGCRAPNDSRLSFARSLDSVWRTPCADTAHNCHHKIAIGIVHESYLDCLIGPWDAASQSTRPEALEPPYLENLDRAAGKDINGRRLSAAIRALGTAASTPNCVLTEAGQALEVLISAQQRSRLGYKHGYHHSHSDTLHVARAVLDQAAAGTDAPLFAALDRVLVKADVLDETLRTLNAAAAEGEARGAAASRLWPDVIRRVLDDVEGHPQRYSDHRRGDDALSQLVPGSVFDWNYMTLEAVGDPLNWRTLTSWHHEIERWITATRGSRRAIDAMVIAIRELPVEKQLDPGLRWIEGLIVEGETNHAQTFTLPEWLRERRTDLSEPGHLASWQRIVDALVIAGDARVADLTD